MFGFFQQFTYGLLNTLLVFVISGLFGTAIGLSAAITKTSKNKSFAMVATTYTGFVRGVPELLIILLIYFGGTSAISAVLGRYMEINALTAGSSALAIVFGAYAAEIFRGAILSVAPGQWEAANSLGFKRWQTWLFVILPQIVPVALPAFCNLCISLMKDTSLISVIGLTDIMRVASVGAGSMHAPLDFYLAASAIYLTLTSVTLVSFALLARHAQY